MSTKVYGQSDDNIYIEGDISDQLSAFDSTVEISFNDGTILSVSYGKKDAGIWQIVVLEYGNLFDRFEECNDENADIYSDIVYFKDGLKSFSILSVE